METDRFQFGIRRLLVLTAAVAVVLAILVRIAVPRIAQLVLAGYFLSLVGWACFRGPRVLANLADTRRRELENEVSQLRRTREPLKSVEDSDRT